MDARPNLTSDSVYPIRMGKAPPKQKRDRGYNDSNATHAHGDKVYLTGRSFNAPQNYGVDQQTGLLNTTWGSTAALGKSEPYRYQGQSVLSQSMAVRNQAGPQQAIIRNQKFHTTSNHKVAVASLQTIEKSSDVAVAARILEKASSTYPLNKMRIPQMPDRFKIRKKFYDNNIEFTLTESGQADDPNDLRSKSVLTTTMSNKDYKNVKATRGVKATMLAQLKELQKMLVIEMGSDVGMRSEYYDIQSNDISPVGNRPMNVRGKAVLANLINTQNEKRWYTVKLTKEDILGTEAITSSNAWYDENLYKKEVIGQSIKLGTPTYQIHGLERPNFGYIDYGLYRVPMFAYVQVKYKPEAVRQYVQEGLDALKWQQKLWANDAFLVAESQIQNAARNYVAILSPQYKSLEDKVNELDMDKATIFKNYNETAKAKGRMGMDNALSKMRFTDTAVQKTVNEVVAEYNSVWKHVSKAKSTMPRPSWGQIKIKHIDKVDQILITFQDNYGITGTNRDTFDQIRISCNLKEVALTYKAVVSPWVRQISLNHSLMVQWKKNFDRIGGKPITYTPTRIFGDRGQEITLPKLMLSRPKYISFKKKKRNLYATWLTLGNWISLANDPNTAAALRFNGVINQDSYLLVRQLEGVLDAVLDAAKMQPAANPKDLNYHAFQVLFSRVVHKAEPGFKSAGIDGSRHAHFKLFDIGNTKGKYIRLNYANNAIGKKNVINLRARLRQFLRHMKKLNSVNQIFQTQVKDRGFEMNMMEIAGNCVMLSMASKFLPNHDFFTYIDNDDMVEQVKGNSMNTVMQMLTLMQAQKIMKYTMGEYCQNISMTINKMAGLAQQTVRRSFASDFMRTAQQTNSSDRSTADSDSSNPMVALSKIDLHINYQSGQYNNSNLATAEDYGQNKGLETAFKLSINSVIRCKQLKQSTVAIISKDLEIFQLVWISEMMPGAQEIAKRDIEESITKYDNALKRFGVQNFVGTPMNAGGAVNNGIDGAVNGILKGHQPFMDMIAFYRGFIEIMDSAGQLFTLYQLRVYKGATDEEFMAFLLYYLEISRQVIVLLIPRFIKLRIEFLWRSASQDLGSAPVPESAVLSAFIDKQLKSQSFATFEYRIVWGLQEMIGRIRQPSAAGQPSMRTIGYKMSVNSFPDAPITSIAGDGKYGRPQNVLIEANRALSGYDGKAPVQPQKMGRTQLGGNVSDIDIDNPRQIPNGQPYDFIEGGAQANAAMNA